MADRWHEERILLPGDRVEASKVQTDPAESIGYFSAHLYSTTGTYTLVVKYGNFKELARAVTLAPNPLDGISGIAHVQFAIPFSNHIWFELQGAGDGECMIKVQ